MYVIAGYSKRHMNLIWPLVPEIITLFREKKGRREYIYKFRVDMKIEKKE